MEAIKSPSLKKHQAENEVIQGPLTVVLKRQKTVTEADSPGVSELSETERFRVLDEYVCRTFQKLFPKDSHWVRLDRVVEFHDYFVCNVLVESVCAKKTSENDCKKISLDTLDVFSGNDWKTLIEDCFPLLIRTTIFASLLATLVLFDVPATALHHPVAALGTGLTIILLALSLVSLIKALTSRLDLVVGPAKITILHKDLFTTNKIHVSGQSLELTLERAKLRRYYDPTHLQSGKDDILKHRIDLRFPIRSITRNVLGLRKIYVTPFQRNQIKINQANLILSGKSSN